MFSYLSNLSTFRLLVMEKPEDPGDLTPCFIVTPQFKFWNLAALGNSSSACLLRYPLYHPRTWKVYTTAPPFLFSQSTLICGMEVCFGFKMPSVSWQCWVIFWSALKAYYKNYSFFKESELWIYNNAAIGKNKNSIHIHSFNFQKLTTALKGKHIHSMYCVATMDFERQEFWVHGVYELI